MCAAAARRMLLGSGATAQSLVQGRYCLKATLSCVDIDSNEGQNFELWKKWAIIGQLLKLPPATRRAETPLLSGGAALILANSTLG